MALQSKSYTNWLQLYIQNRFQSPLSPWADEMSPEWKLLSRSFEKFGSMVDRVSLRNFQPHSDVFWNQGMMVMGFQHEGFMMPSIVTGQQVLGQWLAFFGGRLTLVGFEDCFSQTLELASEGWFDMRHPISSFVWRHYDISVLLYRCFGAFAALEHDGNGGVQRALHVNPYWKMIWRTARHAERLVRERGMEDRDN